MSKSAISIPFKAPSESERLVQPIDVPIPEGMPTPPLWKLLVIPVGQRKITKGGILLPDEIIDLQNWHHQLFKVAAVGPQVYKGPAYAAYDIDDSEKPKVGELWIVDPKQPRRFGYAGMTVIVINDDQLQAKVDPDSVSSLKFFGMELG